MASSVPINSIIRRLNNSNTSRIKTKPDLQPCLFSIHSYYFHFIFDPLEKIIQLLRALGPHCCHCFFKTIIYESLSEAGLTDTFKTIRDINFKQKRTSIANYYNSVSWNTHFISVETEASQWTTDCCANFYYWKICLTNLFDSRCVTDVTHWGWAASKHRKKERKNKSKQTEGQKRRKINISEP